MSIQAEVTSVILRQLEAGVRPWAASWNQGGGIAMPIRSNGERYNGINILLLWDAMQRGGYRQPRFMTFNQAKALGGSVRKGEKASKVVYASTFSKEVENAKGETEEQNIHFLKQYAVFNVEQIDGLPAECFVAPRTSSEAERIVAADDFLMRTGVEVRHGGGVACYSPKLDVVTMPELSRFNDAPSYYATLAHELAHATRHETRLNRDFGRKRFGDEGYAMEELVAELSAAFLCVELGISAEPREDHASYLASWLKVLKGDVRAIFTAASYASKACDKLREMVAAYQPKAPQPTPTAPAPRRARKAREAAPVGKVWAKGFKSMGAARAAAKAEGVQGIALQLRDFGGEGWGWSRYEGEPAPVVIALPKAPKAKACSPVAPELARPFKVAKRAKRVGDFVVTWEDGSSTRVSSVVWTKDCDQWAAAYQAANRLRRLRARHTLIANPTAYLVTCAGISQLSPVYWAHLASLPMPTPVRIEMGGSTLAWGEATKLAA